MRDRPRTGRTGPCSRRRRARRSPPRWSRAGARRTRAGSGAAPPRSRARIISSSSVGLDHPERAEGRRRRDRLPARSGPSGAARRRRRPSRARRRACRRPRGRGPPPSRRGPPSPPRSRPFGTADIVPEARGLEGRADHDGITILEEKQGRQTFTAVEIDARQVEEVGRRGGEEAVGGQRREALRARFRGAGGRFQAWSAWRGC